MKVMDNYEVVKTCPNPACKSGYVYLIIDGKTSKKLCPECNGHRRIFNTLPRE
jgi:hypothetical protein